MVRCVEIGIPLIKNWDTCLLFRVTRDYSRQVNLFLLVDFVSDVFSAELSGMVRVECFINFVMGNATLNVTLFQSHGQSCIL